MLILVVEDDRCTRDSINALLQVEGHRVVAVETGAEAIEIAAQHDFAIILLDLGLPDIGGLEVIKAIRAAKIKTPIIVVSGIADIQAKVWCFTHGADDYMVKPFHKDELLARIEAVCRRDKASRPVVITVGEISVNLSSKKVYVDDEAVAFTVKEYELIELLAVRARTIVTKDMLMEKLYQGRDEAQIKIIDVFVCKVRRKLRALTEGREHIGTSWGRGWVLREPGGAPDSQSYKPRGVTRDIIVRERAAANAALKEAAP